MKKTIYLLIPTLLLLFTACLDNGGSEGAQDAVAEIDVTLYDEATGSPLSNFEVLLLFEVQGVAQPVTFQEFETDEAGFFSSEIFSLTQDRITKAIIEYEVGTEVRSAEKEIDLQLRFEQPYNSASIEMQLDVSE
jgi:hypothetical protein